MLKYITGGALESGLSTCVSGPEVILWELQNGLPAMVHQESERLQVGIQAYVKTCLGGAGMPIRKAVDEQAGAPGTLGAGAVRRVRRRGWPQPVGRRATGVRARAGTHEDRSGRWSAKGRPRDLRAMRCAQWCRTYGVTSWN